MILPFQNSWPLNFTAHTHNGTALLSDLLPASDSLWFIWSDSKSDSLFKAIRVAAAQGDFEWRGFERGAFQPRVALSPKLQSGERN